MMMQDNYVHMKKISGNVHIRKLKENTYKIIFDSVHKWSSFDSKNSKSSQEQVNDWIYDKVLPYPEFIPKCVIKLDKKKYTAQIKSANINKTFCPVFYLTTQKKISEGQFTNAKLSVEVTSIPVDTKGNLYRIHHSKAIHSIAYDATTKVMTISFMRKPENKYEYRYVDAEFWKQFIQNEHPWSAFGKDLRHV